MTTQTNNFDGLLYYNPGAKGFNPVVSATFFVETNPVDEGSDCNIGVVTWNIPDNTTLYWKATNLVNLTNDRFNQASGTFTIVNNRGIFTVVVNADNTTASGTQTYDISISKTLNGSAIETVTITVNDSSQDPHTLVMELDPSNYVPASSSTITITTTFVNGAAGGFPNGGGGSYIRYDGTIATQPSIGDTFVWSGTTYTIAQVLGSETYPPGQEQYYFIGFQPYYGGVIPVGSSIDIAHGSDGLSIIDSSGRGNPGRLNNDVSWHSAGLSSYFILNNGPYITVPTLTNSHLKSVTMSIWFNSNTSSSYRSLIAKELAYKMRLVSGTGDASRLDALAGWSGLVWLYNEVNSYNMPNNQWHHVAVAISPTEINIYINGTKFATATGVGPMPLNSQPLMIGSYGDGTGDLFDGKIGTARLYDYAISSEDVEIYYTLTSARYGVYSYKFTTEAPAGVPGATLTFPNLFTQDVTGWTISGYDVPAGVTVLTQSTIGGVQTQLVLSQQIQYHAVVYSFRAP